jgi:hypothetical protein
MAPNRALGTPIALLASHRPVRLQRAWFLGQWLAICQKLPRHAEHIAQVHIAIAIAV